MKVLIVNKFFRIVGGSETFCFALADLLEKKGHQVVWFSMKDEKNRPSPYEKYFVENIDYYTNNFFKKLKYAMKYIYSFEAKRKMTRILEDEKPDIVHLNLVHHQITLSIIKAITKRKIPVVFTMHDLVCVCPNYMMLSKEKICDKCIRGQYYHCFIEKCVKGSRFMSLLAMIEAYNYKRMKVYNRINAYTSPSYFYKKKLEQSAFTKCPIVHIRNPLPLGTGFGITKERKDYALYFGRLSKEKGIETLIQAMQYTKRPIQLLIVGEGPMRLECEELVKECSVSARVVFLGYKSGLELENIVRQAKCVVLASEWYENGPYAISEAMSYGTPVIVSRNGGLPELVDDGVTGFISEPDNEIDLANKLDAVYNLNEEQYCNMCNNSLAKAYDLFNPEAFYNKIITLYSNLTNRKICTDIR